MPNILNVNEFVVQAGGASFVCNDYDTFDSYVISGSAALTADNDIVFVGTPIANMEFNFQYIGSCTNAGGTVVVFGRALTDVELISVLDISVIYNGSTWDITVLSDAALIDGQALANLSVEASALANDSVTTAKVVDEAITHAKYQQIADERILGNVSGGLASPTALTKGDLLTLLGIITPKQAVVVPVSFESGEQCENTFTVGFPCTLAATYVSGYVTLALAATDDGIVTIKKNGVAISSGTITFAASSALNSAGVIGAFSAENFVAGDEISLSCAKTTAGGKVLISLPLTLTV